MNNYFFNILGFMDTINELNEKLSSFTSKNMDNVFVGTIVFGIILVVAFWGIRTLNK
ncbi:MAG: hypothetical protein IJ097_00405 [Bacilli bacterium]|nr:hypothetical protein [Bacilli bacterium]